MKMKNCISGGRVRSYGRKNPHPKKITTLSTTTTTNGDADKIKKKFRHRNGYHIPKEIKYYQRNTGHLLPRKHVQALIREIAEGYKVELDQTGKKKLERNVICKVRFTAGALTGLQEGLEGYLHDLFSLANEHAVINGRETIMPNRTGWSFVHDSRCITGPFTPAYIKSEGDLQFAFRKLENRKNDINSQHIFTIPKLPERFKQKK